MKSNCIEFYSCFKFKNGIGTNHKVIISQSTVLIINSDAPIYRFKYQISVYQLKNSIIDICYNLADVLNAFVTALKTQCHHFSDKIFVLLVFILMKAYLMI